MKKIIVIILLAVVLLAAAVGLSEDDKEQIPESSSMTEESNEVVDRVLIDDVMTETEIELESEAVKEEQTLAETEPFLDITVDSSESVDNTSELAMHFIDVGQGDATLIVCDGEVMLIDAGDTSKGTTVQFYLKKAGVDHLKYLVCTHPDTDHIGGADVIVTKFDIDEIFMPDITADNNAYRDLVDAMEYRGYTSKMPEVGTWYSLGTASFCIVSPSVTYADLNDNSLIVYVKHGENTFILTGDAEEQAENDLLNSHITINADLYKAGHHGSSSSGSEEFLNCVSPRYAVISCGKDNAYGHPADDTLTKLMSRGTEIFRTDEQGNIVAISDGHEITFNIEPWTAQSVDTETDASTEVNYTYVCNKRTKKFHRLACDSVREMKEKNKWYVDCDRDELIQEGFSPCGGCKP